MPTGSLPEAGKKLYERVYQEAKKGSCKGDEECAARTAWSIVKKKYKKEGDKWVPKSEALAEFSLVIVKASLDKASGEMRWNAVASDTDWDSYDERMSLELFSDFVRRAESKESAPEPFCSEAWCGGLPYPSVAHYMDLDGKGMTGETRRLYVDGNRLKASGIFYDTPLGRACFRSVCEDLYNEESKTREDKVRISIGFLDYAHAHGDARFERKSLRDKCSMCAAGAPEKTYLKGFLLHLALTRVPVNRRTDIVAEVNKAMTTRKEDAASIVGDELAEELERESAIVGKSEALEELPLVERAEEEETPVEAEEEVVEETPEPEVDVPQVEESDIHAELAEIKSSVANLASVLLGKHGKEDEEECTEEMKKEGKCKEHMKEKKSHVLDPVFDALRSEFDRVTVLEGTADEKLAALQNPFNGIAEALRSNLIPKQENLEPVATEAPVSDVPRMIQEALQPLVDQIKLLSTQLTSRSGAEAVANSTPQRRSISPLLIQKAIPTNAENPNSFASIAKKSVGLL